MRCISWRDLHHWLTDGLLVSQTTPFVLSPSCDSQSITPSDPAPSDHLFILSFFKYLVGKTVHTGVATTPNITHWPTSFFMQPLYFQSGDEVLEHPNPRQCAHYQYILLNILSVITVSNNHLFGWLNNARIDQMRRCMYYHILKKCVETFSKCLCNQRVTILSSSKDLLPLGRYLLH